MLLKRFVDKILVLLNINIQKDQGWLLMTSCITGLIYAFSFAPIQKEVVSKMPTQFLSFQALWFCLSALVIGIIWKGRPRRFAIRYYVILAVVESVAAFLLSMYLVFVRYSVWIYAISSMLYSSIVVMFAAKCIMMFESRLWTAGAREAFDNTASVVRNITAIVGFGCASLFVPSLRMAIFMWGLGCIFDDVGWIIVYTINRDRILASE